MRDSEQVFHLAIPCADLDTTVDFYGEKLGLTIARRYEDRVTINFFGDQVVCHLCPEKIDKTPEMYPRHFGITFTDKSKFDHLLNRAKECQLTFFKDLFSRFKGKQEEHLTFFLKDPSNNLLEFKYYYDPAMKY